MKRILSIDEHILFAAKLRQIRGELSAIQRGISGCRFSWW